MSADLLKRAATKLREHAQALPGTMVGPWFIRSDTVIADDGTDVGMLVVDAYNPGEDRPLMAFIAPMNPPVALALAGLLDHVVAVCEKFGPDHDRHLAAVYEYELILARAILREAPDAS